MAGNSINSVRILGDGIRKSLIGKNAISPGHLCSFYNDSGTLKAIVHAVAGGKAQRLIAMENSLVGKDLNTAYADLDYVQLESFPPGAEVNCLVAASAPAIVIGDFVESAGDGTVRKAVGPFTDSSTGSVSTTLSDVTATPTQALINHDVASLGSQVRNAIGIAMEACDNSGGGTAVRLRVELL